MSYDPCYHQACDTFANIALDVLDVNADAVAAATITWARSTRDLGVGDGQRVVARALTAEEPVNHNADDEVSASSLARRELASPSRGPVHAGSRGRGGGAR